MPGISNLYTLFILSICGSHMCTHNSSSIYCKVHLPHFNTDHERKLFIVNVGMFFYGCVDEL